MNNHLSQNIDIIGTIIPDEKAKRNIYIFIVRASPGYTCIKSTKSVYDA